jgi:hypothetical protein
MDMSFIKKKLMKDFMDVLVDPNKLLHPIVDFEYQPYMDFYSQCKPAMIYPVDSTNYYYIPAELKKNLLQFKARATRG